MGVALESSSGSAALDRIASPLLRMFRARLNLILLCSLWVYVSAVLGWTLLRRISGDPTTSNAAAVLIPPALLAICVLALSLKGRTLDRSRRIGWLLVIGALSVDIPAIIDWNHANETTQQPLGTLADVFYLINYGCLTGAAIALFHSCGGSLRNSRVWTDTAVLVVCASAALVPFLVTPLLEHPGLLAPNLLGTMVYIVGIGATATAVIMLFMQVSDWRHEVSTLVFILGLLIGAVTDVLSIGANIRGQFDLFNLDDCAYAIVYALFATAGTVEALGRRMHASLTRKRGDIYSFLPVLAILLSIVIVLGAEARRSNLSIVTAAILLFIGSVLVVARQISARSELRRLNEALMSRQVESRLTELVRQSGDLITVVTPSLRVSYSSPASEALLGKSADQLVGSPATHLLGPLNADRLQELLDSCIRSSGVTRSDEFIFMSMAGKQTTVQVNACNQIDNPLLGGVIVTVHDVSEQRATERELLQAVHRERQRLSSELHEGLGQELTGIYLLVQNLRTALQRGQADLPQLVEETIAHVHDAIKGTRTLARDFSPVQVARGSLDRALEQLALDASQRLRIAITCHAETADTPIPDGAADHLYRIAYEALTNAARHSGGGKADIVLRRTSDGITLSITDNGAGFDPRIATSDGLGIKMMDYRARVLGGTLHFEAAEEGGTRIVAQIPTCAIN